MSKIALSGNASGTGTLTIAAPNTSTDRTLTLPDNTGTIITTGSTVAYPKGGPAFSATTGALTVSASTWTKIPFNAEQFDTNSNYDTTLYRFTPTVAGYYQFSIQLFMGFSTGRGALSIYKNNASTIERFDLGSNTNGGQSFAVNGMLGMNGTTDYVEAYVYQESSGNVTINTSSALTLFQGFLVSAT
jgi:hypothetical protein